MEFTSICSGNMEIWKEIKGYEGLYEVSNLGRIKSLSNKRTGEYSKEIFMKITTRQIMLSKNGTKVLYIIARLVWKHFVGPIPAGYVIDHIIEGNILDNRLCNLQCIPKKDNSTKAAKLKQYKVGAKHGRSKISDDEAYDIWQLSKVMKPKEILSKYPLLTRYVYYNIIGDKYWLHIKDPNYKPGSIN